MKIKCQALTQGPGRAPKGRRGMASPSGFRGRCAGTAALVALVAALR